MPHVSGSPCRVAICDDVADFRKLLAMVLGMEPGLEIAGEAENGREAIDLVNATDIDVLLLDVAMPIMDGIEALPRILEASPSTKVVMLTGFGAAAIRQQALDLGATQYLEKGLTPFDLAHEVRQVCCSDCSG